MNNGNSFEVTFAFVGKTGNWNNVAVIALL